MRANSVSWDQGPGPPPAAHSDSPERLLMVVLEEVLLAQAAELARLGQFASAEGLLHELLQPEDQRPTALDLMARIRAQQGYVAEAEALWRTAIRLDPRNEGYREGLRRAAESNRRSRGRWLRPLLVVLVIGAVLGLTVYLVHREVSNLRSELAGQRPLAPADDPGAKNRDQPVTPQPVPDHTQPPVPAGVPSADHPVLLSLAGPGITTQKIPGGVSLGFTDGLFASGLILKPEGRRLLVELGDRLAAEPKNIHVQVIGHTDDVALRAGGSFADNYTLGVDRALVVMQILRQSSHLPEAAFYVASATGADAPFPNDSLSNRAKNQTATVRVTIP